MKIKEKGLRNIDKFERVVLKLGKRNIKIHKNSFAELNIIKGKLQIGNPFIRITMNDVISVLLENYYLKEKGNQK